VECGLFSNAINNFLCKLSLAWNQGYFHPTWNPIGQIRLVWNPDLLLSFNRGIFLEFFMYFIQNCFICRSSDSIVLEDAGIEPRTVATLALAISGSNPSARSHPQP
jgi:hypothetical protein